MPDLQILIQGQGAEQTAREFAEAIEQELGQRPLVTQQTTRSDTTRADPVAIAALLVAIPGALLAAHDLVQRFKKKEKAEVIIRLAKEIGQKRPGPKISISTPGGTMVALEDMGPNQIIDMATESDGAA